MKDRKISYNLRKPFDLIDSLNKKTPSKIEGVAIGDANLADYEPSNSSRIFINIFPIQFRPLPIPNPHL